MTEKTTTKIMGCAEQVLGEAALLAHKNYTCVKVVTNALRDYFYLNGLDKPCWLTEREIADIIGALLTLAAAARAPRKRLDVAPLIRAWGCQPINLEAIGKERDPP